MVPNLRIVFFLVASATIASALVGCQTPIALQSRRELFVDDLLVESMSGASRQLQTPEVGEISLNFMDRAWEGPWSGQGPTVIKDGLLYRMYYFCPLGSGRRGPASSSGTCYAESQDGIVWTRPNLRQRDFQGSWDNNILQMPDPTFGYIRPFIDTRPGVPPLEKYKAINGGTHIYSDAHGTKWNDGLYILVSPDGLHWNKYSSTPFQPAQRFWDSEGVPSDYDGMDSMFWSDNEQAYVCYYRTWVNVKKPFSLANEIFRGVKRTTSKDLKTWSAPVVMDLGGEGLEHWYFHTTAPYFRAPHIYIAMPAIYHPESASDFRNAPSDGHAARSDSRFASSRGGNRYDRLFPTQRFITTGLPNTDFFFSELTGWPPFAGRLGLNLVPTASAEMSIYLEQPGRVVRYKLRTDGFVALVASGTGHAVTRPVTFTGNALEVNVQTEAGGQLRVELQDSSGAPLQGFTLADAAPLSGDNISQIVTWGARSDIGLVEGKTVKLRFELQKAKLFSFRFSRK